MRSFFTVAALLTGLAASISCAGGAGNPLSPSSHLPNPGTEGFGSPRQLCSLCEVAIDTEQNLVHVVPMRSVELHFNLTNIMNNGGKLIKLTDLDLSHFLSEGRLDLDVGLENPFSGNDTYTGFDVWGVFTHNGSGTLSYDGLNYPVAGTDAVLENADGYTRWFNRPEFTAAKIRGYTPGNMGTPGFEPSAHLNAYKIFADGLNKDQDLEYFLSDGANFQNRLMFRAGSTNWRRYRLRFPMDSGPILSFQYAVHASWVPPSPDPPSNIPGDFPLEANTDEADFIRVETTETPWFTAPGDFGGKLGLDIKVYDWQGTVNPLGIAGEIGDIKVAGNIIKGLWDGDYGVSSTDPHYCIVHMEIPATGLNVTGSSGNECWVIVESASPQDYSDGGIIPSGFYPGTGKLAAFQRVAVALSPNPSKTLNLVEVTPAGWPVSHVRDLCVQGNYAYCLGDRLTILDVSGLGDPLYVGGTVVVTPYTYGSAIETVGDYCYVAWGGLRIFNVQDPGNPVLVGTCLSWSSEMCVLSGLVYVANSAVSIVDVGGGTKGGSPENPKVQGACSYVGFDPTDMVAENGLVYTVSAKRLDVFDVGGGHHGGSISDPKLEGYLDTGKEFVKMAKWGNYIYIIEPAQGSSQTGKLYTVDVSESLLPVMIGQDEIPGNPHDIWTDGQFLFIADPTFGGVNVFSLANPSDPTYAGVIDTPGSAMKAVRSGSFVYVADFGFGLEKYFCPDPGTTIRVGEYFTPHSSNDVHVSDGYAYLADSPGGFKVVDVGGGGASPSQPLQVGMIEGFSNPTGLFVEDGYAYFAADWYDLSFHVIDIGASVGSPQNPIVAGSCAAGQTFKVHKSGQYAFVTAQKQGLKTIDVDGGVMGGSASNPKLVSTYDTPHAAHGLWAGDGFVYWADGEPNLTAPNGALFVLDVGGQSGSPEVPKLADTYDTEKANFDVKLMDGFAYMLGKVALRVLDVGGSSGSPYDVQLVTEYDSDYTPSFAALCAKYGFVFFATSGGLKVLDVGGGAYGGSPQNPVLAAQVDDVYDVEGIDTDGQYLYLATSSSGLRIFSLW